MKLSVLGTIAVLIVRAHGQNGGNISEGPVVDLGYARFQGNTNSEGITSFLGIPFAAPPIGTPRVCVSDLQGIFDSRRLNRQLPTPLASLTPRSSEASVLKFQLTISDRSTFPHLMLLIKSGTTTTNGSSEDCLALNVYTPTEAMDGNASLPVMVWIRITTTNLN